MIPALAPRSALALPAFLLSVALLAGFTGAFAWAVHYTANRSAFPLAVLVAVFWTTLEWALARLGPVAFPWLGLGYALAPFPQLAGAADLVGVRGLTLWVAAVNGLLAMAVLRYRQRDPAVGRGGTPESRLTPIFAATLLLVLVPASYGVWRASTLELRPAARVAVVQPNIDRELRRAPAMGLDTSLAVLTRLTKGLVGQPVDLVAWPEVALTVELPGDGRLFADVRRISSAVAAPIVAGAYGEGTGHRRALSNSAFVLSGDSTAEGRYDKRRLVPFVERVPFVPSTLLHERTPRYRHFGGLAAGETGPVFGDAGRFGILICFESAFPQIARRYRRDRADYLVNITNDAWFGDEPWYARTTALWQHPAHLTLRAIENRIGIARAANTGFSMFIDPLGRSHAVTPLFVPAVRSHLVLTTDGTTLFTRWGDWLASTAAALAVLILVTTALRPRRS